MDGNRSVTPDTNIFNRGGLNQEPEGGLKQQGGEGGWSGGVCVSDGPVRAWVQVVKAGDDPIGALKPGLKDRTGALRC